MKKMKKKAMNKKVMKKKNDSYMESDAHEKAEMKLINKMEKMHKGMKPAKKKGK